MVGFDLRRKRVISYFVKSSGERERERGVSRQTNMSGDKGFFGKVEAG